MAIEMWGKYLKYFVRSRWIIFYWQDLHYGSWELFLSIGKYLEFKIKWNKE